MDDLVALAMSRPWDALARARAVLAGRPGPYDASVAHQAAGIVLRDYGDVEAGVRELRQALRQARRTGSAEREADVLASLGVALVFAGRTAAGLTAFEAAVHRSSGVLAARVRFRRAIVSPPWAGSGGPGRRAARGRRAAARGRPALDGSRA